RSVLLRRSAYSDHRHNRLHEGQPRRNLRLQVPRHFSRRGALVLVGKSPPAYHERFALPSGPGVTLHWRPELTTARDAAQLARLATAQAHAGFSHLDQLPVPELVTLMAAQARRAGEAVTEATDLIAPVVEAVVKRLAAGGRLIYVGAGTAGRIGMLDAAEAAP